MERLIISGVIILGFLGIYYFIMKKQLRGARKTVSSQGVATGIPSIVYFWSESCGICKSAQKPALDTVLETFGADDLHLSSINASDQKEMAKQWRVMTVPTTFIIDAAGTVRHINNGFASPEKLLKQLQYA